MPEFVAYCGNPRAIQVYAIIARHTDKKNTAFPSRSLIAELASCSDDTVDRSIKFLVRLGALTYVKGGPTKANTYTLRVAAPVRVGSRKGAGGVAARVRHQPEPYNQNHEPDLATLSRSRPMDPYWDALETVFGYRPHNDSSERGVWGKLAKMAMELGDPPDEIVKRAAAWTVGDVWQDRKVPPRLTPPALLKHYQWLGSRVANASEADLDRWRMEWRRASRRAALEGGTDDSETADDPGDHRTATG